MKGVYWRAQRTPSWALAAVALVGGVGLLSAEQCTGTIPDGRRVVKLQAARTAQRAFDQIGLARLQTGVPIEPRIDPSASGLIGVEESDLASNYGHLPAKQTSVNPNFAAVVVDWLEKLGAAPGDTVAIGITGSFPAMNVALYSAVQAMRLEPLIIASVSSSSYGATIPELSWLDMEREMFEAGLIDFRSIASTLGGDQDRALLQSPKARDLIIQAMERNGMVFLDPPTLEQSIEKRLKVIDAACGGCNLVAYVNVGGGEASLGGSSDRDRYSAGINRKAPAGLSTQSVARSLSERGVPVIHIGHIQELAQRFGFPIRPRSQVEVGVGPLFEDRSLQRWIALASLAAVFLALFAVTRLDVAQRIESSTRPRGKQDASPGQMV